MLESFYQGPNEVTREMAQDVMFARAVDELIGVAESLEKLTNKAQVDTALMMVRHVWRQVQDERAAG